MTSNSSHSTQPVTTNPTEFDSSAPRPLSRRAFFAATAAGLGGLALLRFRNPVLAAAASGASDKSSPKLVKIVPFTSAGVAQPAIEVPKIVKTDAEWKQQLPFISYEVTRRDGTEPAGSGKYQEFTEAGIYHCICCDTALFNANTQFDSGTGWPSFWQPIAKENVVEKTDNTFGMKRTAVSCRRCDAHLGHVFDDGPKPTGLRYCMNSVALNLTKLSA
jgi:peptide-methionine (R)-S-oxide reductase